MAIAFGLPALIAAGWYGVDWWQRTHASLGFSRADGDVPALQLMFYPDELAFTSPSPPPPLGSVELDGAAGVSVGASLVPGTARVLYRGEGIGTGLAYVRLGTERSIELRPPTSLQGRVGEPVGFWCYGWRCAGYRAIEGAEITMMSGGEHGVPLATATSDADGHFTIAGFDGSLDALALRVRAPGFDLVHRRIEGLTGHEGERALVALSRVPPRRGRVLLPEGLDPQRLLVLARGLPGVQATPAADGTFVLDHVPRGVEARILLDGLSEDYAWRTVHTDRSREVPIEVVVGAGVSGRVLDQFDNPKAGALVWIDGKPPVRTDVDGRYVLRGVLPGSVILSAQYEPGRNKKKLLGQRQVDLEAGKRREGADIVLNLQSR